MNKQQVEQNMIVLTKAGSHSYGTNIESSDEDYRGICIPSDLGYYFGFLKNFEQMDKGWEDDCCIYDLRKAAKLMAGCNPNMLDLLFCREEDVIMSTPEYKILRENRDLFLSKKARHTFGGYAFAQLKRIKGHREYLLNPPTAAPIRADFGLGEEKLVSRDQTNAFQWMLARFLQDSVEWFKLSESTKEELTGVNWIGMVQKELPEEAKGLIQEATGASDNFIEAIYLEKRYQNAKSSWNSYKSWERQRNPARLALEKKYGYDTKHGMHLVRLMRMGVEILETGTVNVYRPDREELVEIRNGSWSYEELIEYAEAMDKRLGQLYETSTLPKKPKFKQIDALVVDIIKGYIST